MKTISLMLSTCSLPCLSVQFHNNQIYKWTWHDTHTDLQNNVFRFPDTTQHPSTHIDSTLWRRQKSRHLSNKPGAVTFQTNPAHVKLCESVQTELSRVSVAWRVRGESLSSLGHTCKHKIHSEKERISKKCQTQRTFQVILWILC